MARYREQNARIPSKAFFQKKSRGSYTLNTYSAPNTSGSLVTMEDELHAGWKQRIRRGEVVNGRMLLNKYDRTPGSGSYYYSEMYAGIKYETWIWGDVLGAVDQKVTFDQNIWQSPAQSLIDVMLVEAYAKLSDSSIMSGEVMASIGQTMRMLQRPFGSSVKLLSDCYKSARRHYRKTAKSIARANADAWLEYRYGWGPLFMDIEQGLDLYSKREERLKSAFKIVRTSKPFQSTTMKSYDVSCTAPIAYTAQGTATETVKGQVAAGVFYALAGRTPAVAAAEDLRLGASSLASTAWEIVPYSFVADWFVQVGPWLAAVNVPPSVSVRGNWVTTTWEQVITNQNSRIRVYQSPKWTDGTGGSSTRRWTQVYRRVNLPLPTSPPILKALPGVIHATDALALATGKIIGLLEKLRH